MTGPEAPLRSVDRALQMLLALRERGSLRVSDAADQLGVAPSTAHRLLSALRAHGLAEQDSARCYHPGPAMNILGGTARPRGADHLARLLHPYLVELAAATGETAQLMVLTGTGARFIDAAEGAHALRVASRIGLVLPAHVTSGGKALLAELAPDRLAGLYPRGLALMPEATGPDLARLRRELTGVRRRRYARNLEESEQGVNAVGTCVRDGAGRALAAVVVAAPALRVPRRELPRLAGALIPAAERMSAAVAGHGAGRAGPAKLD